MTGKGLDSISVPSAHGIFVTNRRELLVTNIGGGGIDALWKLSLDLEVEDVADTALTTPHNITVDDKHRMFVTHSGPKNHQLSVVDLDRDGFGTIELVTVGTNPFGMPSCADSPSVGAGLAGGRHSSFFANSCRGRPPPVVYPRAPRAGARGGRDG